MPCIPFNSGDGKFHGFMCTRNVLDLELCEVCGNPATKLCDFPLAGSKAGQTCDRKLCDDHATEVDATRLPERFLEMMIEGDTVDVCPAHARYIRAKEESNAS